MVTYQLKEHIMETIYLKENNNNTIIHLNSKYYYGYQFENNDIKNIGKSNLEIFTLFALSKKYKRLAKYGKYDVYLDENTDLKHYLYNGSENYYLLFQNNGHFAINYLGNNNRLTDTKIFNLKNKIIICTCLGLMLALSHIDKPEIAITNSINLLIKDYEPSDISLMISSSPSLTEEEKTYLYNEQFISDALTIVNNFYYEKQQWTKCFNNIDIVGYHDTEHSSLAGYYKKRETPNILYIKDYNRFNEEKKAAIAHEYAHLCQDTAGYNLIIEASADLITKEYFYDEYRYGYPKQVKLLKKLMEIIGSYPVWYYNFTGDFSQIAERVSPYLTREEYKNFLNDLSFDYNNKELNEPKYQELNALLDTLYYRIYDKDIKEDQIITMIEIDDEYLVRYYFNKSMLNEENSYYLDYNSVTYETISYEEAIDRGVIKAYTISYTKIAKEDAFKIIENDKYMLRRDINYRTHNVTISYCKHESSKTTISGIIDGIKYEKINLDDLVKMGIIDVTYYIIDKYNLNCKDYEKYHDKCKIYLTPIKRIIVNEDSIEVLIPKKIYLPPIDTRYQENPKYIKKKKLL